MKLVARAVLASFIISLPGAREVQAQIMRASVASPTATPSLALPQLAAPSVAAPALLLSPALLTPSLLAPSILPAPAIVPVALKPVVPAAAKTTLAVTAKATAKLTPKSGGSESKEAAARAFEGGAESPAVLGFAGASGGNGGGSGNGAGAKAALLAGIRAATPPGTIVSYAKLAQTGARLGFNEDRTGALFTELLQDGHLAVRDNRAALYFTFKSRVGSAPSGRSETESAADAAALEAVHKMNSGAPADHAAAVAKADKAVSLYEKAGSLSAQIAEAKVLRANAALEFATSMLKAHKADLAGRGSLTPALEKRLADAAEVLAWLDSATYETGRVPALPQGTHRKLTALLGSLNPAGANGAAPSGDVVDGYVAALDLLEKFDPRDFRYEGPSKGPAFAASAKSTEKEIAEFAAEIRSRTAPGATVTLETLTRAGRALGLDSPQINARLAALASRGQVLIRASGAVVYFDLREQAFDDEDGVWDLHSEALDGIKLANASDAASHLRAVAKLDAVLAQYHASRIARKSGAIEQVSIALANAKLEAITSALKPRENSAASQLALSMLSKIYYSAERRQDIPSALANALAGAATLAVLRAAIVQPDAELARGAELTRAFIESLKAGDGSKKAPRAAPLPKDRTFASLPDFKVRLRDIGMPEGVQATAIAEFENYLKLDPQDTEAQKIRAYLGWLTDLPWSARTEDTPDIAAARGVLDRDHGGLAAVKERVLEFLAVRKKTGSEKGAIIAFTGPPGTGKTSIASAIAEALGRKFVRLSLGGVHDESVLRGHGRTYVGSMPGEIMRKMKEAGTVNPVMLMDEADKIGRDGNAGDPTAALLEVLDPEQNNTFRDRYLDVPYDLSEVLFVVTSNELSNIPEPLRDRMEIIEFDGYTTLEKLDIAEDHVVPQKREAAGLNPEEGRLTRGAIRAIIEGYTMEAGVRGLREKIETILRKISAWTETRNEPAPAFVEEKDVAKYLGVPRFSAAQIAQNGVGIATGLAVNAYGGSTLNVEVSVEPGAGRLKLRKQFGDDIEDSAKNALKYVKVHAAKYGLQDFDFTKVDIDINITPAGKVDGPSAGGLMVTAILSALTGRSVAPGVAMTGEITMRGDILPIGGLKQKVMAAHRMGYKEVIFPHANLKDIESIPKEVRDGIKLTPARTYDDIYPSAIVP